MLTKKQIYAGVAIGALFSSLGGGYSNIAMQIIGNIIVSYCCYLYAILKGYKGIVGVALGLVGNALGFIVLVILKNKNKTTITAQ